MTENFIINLKPGINVVEDFKTRDENVVKLSIQSPKGEHISGQGFRIYMRLSKDAKIGLATELIRSALKNDEDNIGMEHLYPADRDLATQNYGIYLHPESCELLIFDEEFGTLENLLKCKNP